MTDGRWRQRLTSTLAPALLVVLPLCLFGPHTIYSGNEAEFSASFWVLIPRLLLVGGAIASTLVVIGLVLPQMLFRAYLALLFGLGLVIWIQGNFLVPDYGTFTGTAIDFSAQNWRNPYELALWIGLPLALVAAARFVAPIAPFASALLVALQLVTLTMAEVQAEREPGSQWRGPAESMFDMSRRQNVLHIVLDGFQSEFFHEILEEDRAIFDRSWSGAVFYADHVGAFPSTIVSIPAMLTGSVYRNERNLQQYMRDHFDGGSLFKSLRAAGYRVDSITEMQYDNRSATTFYKMPRPYVAYSEYKQFAAWQLADLSLFRHAPHRFRPAIFNNDEWRLQTRFGPGDTKSRRLHPVNGAVVLRELSRRLHATTDEPVYKFIHVGIPHLPVAVGADCEFTGVARISRERYKGQAKCALTRVTAILDRLKEIGVYDNTLVVVSSDHGLGFAPRDFVNNRQLPPGPLTTLAAKAMALLVVKPSAAAGAVRISRAPTAITDIPATILGAARVKHSLPGESALTLNEHAPRRRSFAMYDWEHEDWRQTYFDTLDVMEIEGPMIDGNNWRFVDTLYAPGGSDEARIRGLRETHRSRTGQVYRWSLPQAYFHPPPGARSFEITVRSIASTPQTVTVSVAGRVLEKVILSDQSWVTVKKPLPPAETAADAWVDLRVDPPWRPGNSGRMLGVQTRDIKWGR